MEGNPDFDELENWFLRKGDIKPKFLKVNEKGEQEWYKVIRHPAILKGELLSLIQTSDGGYIGVGQVVADCSAAPAFYNPTSSGAKIIYQQINGEGRLGLVVKISNSGALQWTYAYGLADDITSTIDYPNNPARETRLYDIEETDNGNFFIVGYSSISTEISGRKSVFLLNINSQGLINWKSSYIPTTTNANIEFFGNSIKKVGTEFIIGAMHKETNNSNYKPFFIKRINENANATSIVNFGFDNANNPPLFEYTKMTSFAIKGNNIYATGIHNCTSCPTSEHGEGILKVDVFNKNTLNYVKSINIKNVRAYDLKAGITVNANNELFLVSTVLHNTWQWLWGSNYSFLKNCGFLSPPEFYFVNPSEIDFWSTDAMIAKIDVNDNIEWIKIFDAQNTHADFPKDIRNEECLYNIIESPNGDIVAVGNCSNNLDDDYIVCLSKCQDNTSASNCLVSLKHIRNDNANLDYTFSSNVDWINQNMVIAGRIIVNSGAILTIKNSTISFTPNSRTNNSNGSKASEVESYIIVKPGGTLIIDNSTLKAQGCGDQFWKGIIVEGCGSANYQPPLNQVYDFNTHDYLNVSKIHPNHACAGKVIITPGSNVMNARTAVYSGSSVGDWDDSKSGGIIISDGATFLNNHRDIGFVNYTKPNISYFKNTKFESNNFNDRTGINHITAWNVDNIVFEACDFMANNTNNPTFEGEYIDIHRGIGIYAIQLVK